MDELKSHREPAPLKVNSVSYRAEGYVTTKITGFVANDASRVTSGAPLSTLEDMYFSRGSLVPVGRLCSNVPLFPS